MANNLHTNPHADFLISPRAFVRSVVMNKSLLFRLIRVEVIGRYRGSFLGLLWSFFNPVLMLLVYTFVFSVVLKARWPGGTESKTEFAMILFAGLLVFNLFSECINRAPSLILGNANYVKKVVFPLEILPVVLLGSALFHLAVSFVVWVLFYAAIFGSPPATIVYLPIVLFPLVLLTLGVSWFLASVGVYLRDVSQVIGVVTTVFMFMLPIFYPASALPDEYRTLVQWSPLAVAVEQARSVMIWGQDLNLMQWSFQFTQSAVIAWLGFFWFQVTRKGFADVV